MDKETLGKMQEAQARFDQQLAEVKNAAAARDKEQFAEVHLMLKDYRKQNKRKQNKNRDSDSRRSMSQSTTQAPQPPMAARAAAIPPTAPKDEQAQTFLDTAIEMFLSANPRTVAYGVDMLKQECATMVDEAKIDELRDLMQIQDSGVNRTSVTHILKNILDGHASKKGRKE
jgi:hypothetical protein